MTDGQCHVCYQVVSKFSHIGFSDFTALEIRAHFTTIFSQTGLD